MLSSQFNDSHNSGGRSGKGLTSGSRRTELVTIGGTGAKRDNQHFNRLEDGSITIYDEGHDVDSDKRRDSDSDLSGQMPLRNITVKKDVFWSENKSSSGSPQPGLQA
jgi:hypothetical protein